MSEFDCKRCKYDCKKCMIQNVLDLLYMLAKFNRVAYYIRKLYYFDVSTERIYISHLSNNC